MMSGVGFTAALGSIFRFRNRETQKYADTRTGRPRFFWQKIGFYVFKSLLNIFFSF